ncbi:hypothetical protein DAE56_26795 [Salmonella enterica]|nr:hypothetical protein [Salmonella enterica]
MPDLANHPGLHMPRAATSWASCLFAVDVINLQFFIVVCQQLFIVLFALFCIPFSRLLSCITVVTTNGRGYEYNSNSRG